MKLLATDYDGTLKFGNSILQQDIDAINQWRERGNIFAIVTGRSKESITKELEEFQIPVDYYVTNNGGMVFDANGNKLLETSLDSITAIDLMFASHEDPDIVSYMVNDGVNRHKVEVHPNLQDHRYPHIQQTWSEEEIMDSGRFAQIVFSCTTPETALELADKINQYFGSSVTAFANNFVVDVVPKGVSKATGLDFVEAFADINDENTYSMGDSHNDIPMLESNENSAAHALAPYEVTVVAAHTFGSVHDYIEFALAQ
ncbi:HAD-IIB family hydrolase [Erysipelotrichaceae bacterium RD49]|nr:HAD-IIB family hydrolase [Erysipelotrichaceae bacterium RD49]